MLDKISMTVGTPDRTQLNRKLTPILAELVTLKPGNEQHPVVTQLFNLLVDPQLTGEEYTYIIGELAEEVFRVMEQHFPDYMYDKVCFPYLCVTASEALAVRCPVLEGLWEEAAWTLLVTTYCKQPYKFFVSNDLVVSDRLSAWIIHVIVDADLCPNSYLRLDMLELLMRMVHINEFNVTQVMEAILSMFGSLECDQTYNEMEWKMVMSTCPSPNTAYIKANLRTFKGMQLTDITYYLRELTQNYTFLGYDKKLAKKLLDQSSLRCSVMVHDVRYITAINPQRFSEPRELHGLVHLLKKTARIIERIAQLTLEEEYCIHSVLMCMISFCETLHVIISTFKLSCQTPQLVGLTSLCIIDIAELAIQLNGDIDEEEDVEDYIHMFNKEGLDKICLLMDVFWGEYGGLSLPSRPPRLGVIKKHMESSNKPKLNLYDCYSIFLEIYWPL